VCRCEQCQNRSVRRIVRSVVVLSLLALVGCGGGQPPGQLIGLDARTGRVRWRHSVGNASALVRWRDRMIGAERDGLVALDSRSGHVVWRTSAPLTSPPDSPSGVLLAGDVVVQGGSRSIIGFAADTGRRLWTHPIPGVAIVSLSGDAGGVYARLDRSWSLLALDPLTGRTRWKVDVGACADSRTPCSLFALGGHDIVSAGDLTVATETSTERLVGLDARTGATRWEQPIAGTIQVSDGLLIVRASRAGVLVAVDPTTGGERWRSAGSDVFASAVDDGTVLVGRGDGMLVALDSRTGTMRWQQRVERPRYSYGVAAGDGLAVVATFDRVVAFDLGNGRPRWARHLSGSAPNRTYSQPGQLLDPTVAGSMVVIAAQPPQRPED
jgi:eukaryotic-like serine/threonine-protein kinase